MLVDSHVHLQAHGGKTPPLDRRLLNTYAEAATANGLTEIAITEHLFRFREAYDLLAGWWDEDPNPGLAAMVRRYWDDHVSMRLPDYVELIQTAKSDGLPLRLGMEMDWIPGKLEALQNLLAPYDWDIVLGSVHWIGAFGFDDEEFLPEWDRRQADEVFKEYARLIGDLADSGLPDVLAHVDLPKLFGHQPSDMEAFHSALLAAAQRGSCALEINTNGLRKAGGIYPDLALLRAARIAGIATTLASDAHTPDRLGAAFDVAVAHARQAGFTEFVSFAHRRRRSHGLVDPSH
jgi:histidinol-phosphatase (PHP family)